MEPLKEAITALIRENVKDLMDVNRIHGLIYISVNNAAGYIMEINESVNEVVQDVGDDKSQIKIPQVVEKDCIKTETTNDTEQNTEVAHSLSNIALSTAEKHHEECAEDSLSLKDIELEQHETPNQDVTEQLKMKQPSERRVLQELPQHTGKIDDPMQDIEHFEYSVSEPGDDLSDRDGPMKNMTQEFDEVNDEVNDMEQGSTHSPGQFDDCDDDENETFHKGVTDRSQIKGVDGPNDSVVSEDLDHEQTEDLDHEQTEDVCSSSSTNDIVLIDDEETVISEFRSPEENPTATNTSTTQGAANAQIESPPDNQSDCDEPEITWEKPASQKKQSQSQHINKGSGETVSKNTFIHQNTKSPSATNSVPNRNIPVNVSNAGNTVGNLFNCGICSVQFTQYAAVEAHFAAKHTYEAFFSCLLCSEYFPNRTTFQLHRSCKHPDETYFICPHCKTGLGQDECAYHRQECRPDYEQEVRNGTNARSQQRSYHSSSRYQHTGRSRPMAADRHYTTGHPYRQKVSARAAQPLQFVSTPAKPFTPAARPSPRAQIRSAAPHSPHRVFRISGVCDQCKRDLGNFRTLEQHVLVTHGRYICNICACTFSSKWNLHSHIKIHTG